MCVQSTSQHQHDKEMRNKIGHTYKHSVQFYSVALSHAFSHYSCRRRNTPKKKLRTRKKKTLCIDPWQINWIFFTCYSCIYWRFSCIHFFSSIFFSGGCYFSHSLAIHWLYAIYYSFQNAFLSSSACFSSLSPVFVSTVQFCSRYYFVVTRRKFLSFFVCVCVSVCTPLLFSPLIQFFCCIFQIHFCQRNGELIIPIFACESFKMLFSSHWKIVTRR